MPAGGAYPLDWVAFAKAFEIPRVDLACPGFYEQWQYILAWVYCKHCLDAARKWKVDRNPPVEVCWLGEGKPPLKERMVNDLWAAT